VNNDKRLPDTEIAAYEKQKDRIEAGSAMALLFYFRMFRALGMTHFHFSWSV
jgi:hypothetical protein